MGEIKANCWLICWSRSKMVAINEWVWDRRRESDEGGKILFTHLTHLNDSSLKHILYSINPLVIICGEGWWWVVNGRCGHLFTSPTPHPANTSISAHKKKLNTNTNTLNCAYQHTLTQINFDQFRNNDLRTQFIVNLLNYRHYCFLLLL